MAIINAITDTWNNAGTVFTAIKMTVTNTASASGSKLIDLLVGASSKFSVDKDGAVVVAGSIAMPAGTEGAPSIWFGQSNTGIYSNNAARVTISAGGTARLECSSQQVLVEAAAKLGWVSVGSASGGTFQVGFIKDSNTQVGVYSAGSVYADLKARNLIATGVVNCALYTVATLPSAATSGNGARAHVSDALAPTFGATVAAGGAVSTPVYSDGTNWKVG